LLQSFSSSFLGCSEAHFGIYKQILKNEIDCPRASNELTGSITLSGINITIEKANHNVFISFSRKGKDIYFTVQMLKQGRHKENNFFFESF
jgi:hypothetical protein